MDTESLHELTAAYALDALSPDEERAYEQHLAHCERCRRELAEFSEATTALAHGGDAGAPPPALRDRILDAARADRPNVVPLRPRWVRPLGAAAAVAAVAAVVLGIWAVSLSRSLDHSRSARADLRQAIAVIGDPRARRASLAGGNGMVFVAPDGATALVAFGLDRAAAGKTYEAWVIPAGRSPQPAGLFDSAGATTVVRLGRRAGPGTTVAVTMEPRGGSGAPTGPVLYQAHV
jgi:anti-sigma-K factor RskA